MKYSKGLLQEISEVNSTYCRTDLTHEEILNFCKNMDKRYNEQKKNMFTFNKMNINQLKYLGIYNGNTSNKS